MSGLHGYNAMTMKRLNRGMVLRLLCRESLSRRQIAQATSLRSSTISLIVAELLDAGLVCEHTHPLRSEVVRPGRQEVPLMLAPQGAYAIGVHIGIFGAQVALANARAELVAYVGELLPAVPTPEAVIAQLTRLIRQLIEQTGIDVCRLIGVGAGAMAYVDAPSGVIRRADHLGWRDVPFAAQLAAAVGYPVYLEHNVRAMALAEQIFGQQRAPSTFIFLNVGTSIGAAIVVDGQLVEGHAHDAGQLGHVRVIPDGPRCGCGQHGCLDAVASMQAIRERALRLCQTAPDSALAHRLRGQPLPALENRVLALAATGDALAIASITPAIEPLTSAMAVLLAVLDPAFIIVSAGSSAYDEVLITPLRHSLSKHVGLPAGLPPLVPTSFGHAQAVLGGAAVALQHLFESPDVVPHLARHLSGAQP